MRLNSKKDAEILEKSVMEVEGLRETVQCTIPRLRSPRIVVFDVPSDIQGSEVIAAATVQASMEVGSMSRTLP